LNRIPESLQDKIKVQYDNDAFIPPKSDKTYSIFEDEQNQVSVDPSTISEEDAQRLLDQNKDTSRSESEAETRVRQKRTLQSRTYKINKERQRVFEILASGDEDEIFNPTIDPSSTVAGTLKRIITREHKEDYLKKIKIFIGMVFRVPDAIGSSDYTAQSLINVSETGENQLLYKVRVPEIDGYFENIPKTFDVEKEDKSIIDSMKNYKAPSDLMLRVGSNSTPVGPPVDISGLPDSVKRPDGPFRKLTRTEILNSKAENYTEKWLVFNPQDPLVGSGKIWPKHVTAVLMGRVDPSIGVNYLYENALYYLYKLNEELAAYIKQYTARTGQTIPITKLTPNEGYRTFVDQRERGGDGKREERSEKGVAATGSSRHQCGVAIDTGGMNLALSGKNWVTTNEKWAGHSTEGDLWKKPQGPVFEWMNENAWRFGWRRTVSNEVWHWEFRDQWVNVVHKNNHVEKIDNSMQSVMNSMPSNYYREK